MSKPSLARLQRVDLRSYWEREDTEFTPWLAAEENIKLLGDAIGIELEVEQQEASVGPFRADILCRNAADDSQVLIENQLERTNHTHLGQILTYAAGLDTVSIVWIAQRFTEEHRAALDWLNRISDDTFHFFGLEVELWRIGESDVAPKFNVVAKPNDWTRVVKEAALGRGGALETETKRLRLEYWSRFAEFLEEHRSSIRTTAPTPRAYMGFPIGRRHFRLSAAVVFRSSEVRVSLVIRGGDASAYFRLLELQRSAIEAELGFEVEWLEKPERKLSVVTIRHAVDLNAPSNWPDLHAWMLEKLQAFDGVFRSRIMTLDASQWQGEEEEAEA